MKKGNQFSASNYQKFRNNIQNSLSKFLPQIKSLVEQINNVYSNSTIITENNKYLEFLNLFPSFSLNHDRATFSDEQLVHLVDQQDYYYNLIKFLFNESKDYGNSVLTDSENKNPKGNQQISSILQENEALKSKVLKLETDLELERSQIKSLKLEPFTHGNVFTYAKNSLKEQLQIYFFYVNDFYREIKNSLNSFQQNLQTPQDQTTSQDIQDIPKIIQEIEEKDQNLQNIQENIQKSFGTNLITLQKLNHKYSNLKLLYSQTYQNLQQFAKSHQINEKTEYIQTSLDETTHANQGLRDQLTLKESLINDMFVSKGMPINLLDKHSRQNEKYCRDLLQRNSYLLQEYISLQKSINFWMIN